MKILNMNIIYIKKTKKQKTKKTKPTKKQTNKILHIKKELNTRGKTKKVLVMTSCFHAFILVMNGHTNVCVGKKIEKKEKLRKNFERFESIPL